MIKMAMFDTKPYDREAFSQATGTENINIKYYEAKLNADTVQLAQGYDGVIAFVNDVIDHTVIDALHRYGVRSRLLPTLRGRTCHCHATHLCAENSQSIYSYQRFQLQPKWDDRLPAISKNRRRHRDRKNR